MAWEIPANGRATIAVSVLQGICISACSFDITNGDITRALRAANLIESALTMAQCSAILHELCEARVFESEFGSESEWFEGVRTILLSIPKHSLSNQHGWRHSSRSTHQAALQRMQHAGATGSSRPKAAAADQAAVGAV